MFPVMVSLEVMLYGYAPRHYDRTLFDSLKPWGVATHKEKPSGRLSQKKVCLRDELLEKNIFLYRF